MNITNSEIIKIQQILPLGYLYLIIIGLIKESITYSFIGINILKYFGLSDIIFSPVSVMFSHPIILLAFIIMGLLLYYSRKLILKYPKSKKIKNILGIKTEYRDMNEVELSNFADSFTIRTFVIGFIFVFIGFAIAEGQILKDELKSKTLKYNKTLNFNSGESEKVHLLSCNSMYYFYICKDEHIISISPISSVKSIKMSE